MQNSPVKSCNGWLPIKYSISNIMTDKNKSRWRPYLEYLEQLAQQREEAGLPKVPHCDDSYWDERRRNDELKQQPRE
jgi:hypothetical protein